MLCSCGGKQSCNIMAMLFEECCGLGTDEHGPLVLAYKCCGLPLLVLSQTGSAEGRTARRALPRAALIEQLTLHQRVTRSKNICLQRGGTVVRQTAQTCTTALSCGRWCRHSAPACTRTRRHCSRHCSLLPIGSGRLASVGRVGQCAPYTSLVK